MKSAKVAIVDDEAGIVEVCQGVLDAEFEVETFTQPERFLESLSQGYHPEVLLTDLRMPNLSGISLAQSIYERKVPTQVLIMSGYADREDLIAAMSANVVGFIDKPFDVSHLVSMVERTSSRSAQELEMRRIFTAVAELLQSYDSLNLNYYKRLALAEDLVMQLNPKIFDDKQFRDRYLCFLKEQGILERRISFIQRDIGNSETLVLPLLTKSKNSA